MNKPEHYLVLEPNGELRWIQVSDRNYLAAAFRKAIGCDLLEHVYLPYGFGCVVDECGKIKLDPQPFNPLASRFYPGTAFGDPLVGPVVFVRIGLVDGESDWVPLEDGDLCRISLMIGKEIPEFYSPGIDDQGYIN